MARMTVVLRWDRWWWGEVWGVLTTMLLVSRSNLMQRTRQLKLMLMLRLKLTLMLRLKLTQMLKLKLMRMLKLRLMLMLRLKQMLMLKQKQRLMLKQKLRQMLRRMLKLRQRQMPRRKLTRMLKPKLTRMLKLKLKQKLKPKLTRMLKLKLKQKLKPKLTRMPKQRPMLKQKPMPTNKSQHLIRCRSLPRHSSPFFFFYSHRNKKQLPPKLKPLQHLSQVCFILSKMFLLWLLFTFITLISCVFTASDEAAAKSKAIPTPTLKRGASKTTQGKFPNSIYQFQINQ